MAPVPEPTPACPPHRPAFTQVALEPSLPCCPALVAVGTLGSPGDSVAGPGHSSCPPSTRALSGKLRPPS